jgi:hypothetical protein
MKQSLCTDCFEFHVAEMGSLTAEHEISFPYLESNEHNGFPLDLPASSWAGMIFR